MGLFMFSSIQGQNVVYKQLQHKLQQGEKINNIDVIESWDQLDPSLASSIDIQNGIQITLDYYQLENLHKNRPNLLQTSVITTEGEISILLEAVDLFVTESILYNDFQQLMPYERGVHYRGIIKGEANSLVAISFFPTQIMGFISSDDARYTIGQLSNDLSHVVYENTSLSKNFDLNCETSENLDPYSYEKVFQSPVSKSLDKCVEVYIEIDYDIVKDKGGIDEAADYITGLFNQSFALYANDDINLKISEIKAWANISPYESLMASGMLGDFQQNIDEFNGDIAHLVSYKASGGIAAGFSGLCNSNPDMSMCFSSISDDYNDVPLYSWSVMVITHEMGHLLGSRHTHACVWNGDGSAIDGCAAYVEGDCQLPGIPEMGGTIMSYCHGTEVGINFSNGFGLQPGNVIRNTIAQSYCLESCDSDSETSCNDGIQNGKETGVDCGGPDCEPCEELCENIDILIKFDKYAKETSWDIKDESNELIFTGGPYDGSKNLQTILFEKCMPFGCYTFTIYDSYGDGICCAYGNGFFKLYNENGEILGKGGKFKREQSIEFCLTAPISCEDGIQNGEETGIDCGGPSCADCPDPTCEDGVQNGEETGIDCGGPNCPDCATCEDGIQNGEETGIDCGSDECGPCTMEYCESKGKISFYEYIDIVELGEFTNQSGNDNGYGNYKEMNINFPVDETLSVNLYPKHPYFAYQEYWRIWIDLNQDGDFEDKNELRLQGSGDGPIQGKISLPQSTIPGITTMRITMKYGSFPEPCETFSFGEVEDYAVNIISGLNLSNNSIYTKAIANNGQFTTSNKCIKLFPNPAKDHLSIQFLYESSEYTSFSIVDIYGHSIMRKVINTPEPKQIITVDTDLFLPGIYLLILDQDGKKTTEKFIIGD